MNLLNVYIRTAGALVAHGIWTHKTAKEFIEAKWYEYAPSVAGVPSEKARQMETVPAVVGTGTFTAGLWCESCGIHRVLIAGGLCPVCAGPSKRRLAS